MKLCRQEKTLNLPLLRAYGSCSTRAWAGVGLLLWEEVAVGVCNLNSNSSWSFQVSPVKKLQVAHAQASGLAAGVSVSLVDDGNLTLGDRSRGGQGMVIQGTGL